MKILLSLLLAAHCLQANIPIDATIKAHFFDPDVETLPISNWENPSIEDYFMIQDFMDSKRSWILETPIASRPFPSYYFNTDVHGWITYRMGRLRLINSLINPPVFQTECFGNDPNKKDTCVICYAAYPRQGAEDREYSRGIDWIIKSLKQFHFNGHFIYRIGGWPNLKNGRLKLADVPYAFKPFLFEEVRDLGYKKILWLDAASVPVKSLDPIFDFLNNHACCFFSFDDSVMSERDFQDRAYNYLMAPLNLTKTTGIMKSINTQVLGFNLEHPKGIELLNRWIDAAEKKIPFLESDQPPFVFLANELNLLDCRLPTRYHVEGGPNNFLEHVNNKTCIIYHQYQFLNPTANIPENLLKLWQ